jgi:phytoene desaturase
MKKKITIIGSGFSALAASCYLAKSGHQVEVFEKNATIGGRARQLKRDGFTFDMEQVGIGCPMCLIVFFFFDFGKKQRITMSL